MRWREGAREGGEREEGRVLVARPLGLEPSTHVTKPSMSFPAIFIALTEPPPFLPSPLTFCLLSTSSPSDSASRSNPSIAEGSRCLFRATVLFRVTALHADTEPCRHALVCNKSRNRSNQTFRV